MEPMTVTVLPGRTPITSQDEVNNTLDNLARELARNKSRQHGDDKHQHELGDALPTFPIQPRPLLPALIAFRRGEHEHKKVQWSGNTPEPGKIEAKGGEGIKPLHKTQGNSLDVTIATDPDIESAQIRRLEMSLPSSVSTAPALSRMETSDKRAQSVLSRMEASDKRAHAEGAVSILPVSQPVQFSSMRQPIEIQTAMSSHMPVAAQAVEVPMMQPSGLTYRFTRWGAEHAVTVQGQTGGAFLLQPSDSLVTQQLSAQWQSGEPQKWQLARDGSEGREQSHQQKNEEDED